MTISLCMIVKDEEEVLRRCLLGIAKWVDEIIVVDTGSTDGTKKIAKEFTDKVYDFRWIDDFSAARNYSFSLATGDYLLWLDADDYVPKEEIPKLILLRKRLETEQPDGIFCPYFCSVNEYTPPLAYYRERFLRRSANPVWKGAVHECIAVKGAPIYSDFSVWHYGSSKPRGDRNLRIYFKEIEKGIPLSARDEFYYARELYYNGFFTESIARIEKFLNRADGWRINKIEACKIRAYCFLHLGEEKKALSSLFSSFLYGPPRAGILCEIAHIFTRRNDFREAEKWYLFALHAGSHTKDGDFETQADYTLTPLLGLTSVCFRLGEKEKAKAYHNQAFDLYPTHPSVLYNETFFKKTSP